MAEASKTHAAERTLWSIPCLSGMLVRRRLHGSVPFGLRRNLDRGTAPRARPRPGRGAVWPSLRCRHRRHTSVWVFVAAARRYAPTSPAPPRLAYGPPALATRPFVLSPRTARAPRLLGAGPRSDARGRCSQPKPGCRLELEKKKPQPLTKARSEEQTAKQQ